MARDETKALLRAATIGARQALKELCNAKTTKEVEHWHYQLGNYSQSIRWWKSTIIREATKKKK